MELTDSLRDCRTYAKRIGSANWNSVRLIEPSVSERKRCIGNEPAGYQVRRLNDLRSFCDVHGRLRYGQKPVLTRQGSKVEGILVPAAAVAFSPQRHVARS